MLYVIARDREREREREREIKSNLHKINRGRYGESKRECNMGKRREGKKIKSSESERERERERDE